MLKKGILYALLSFICFIVGTILVANTLFSGYEQEEDRYKELLGLHPIIKNDTLTIINYSIVKDVVILDNGLEVSPEFLLTIEVLKK